MTGKDPLIELHDLHLTLPSSAGPVPILRGLDLSVEAGTTLGLVGPSGSGKSTLLMVLAGLERATSGRVMVAGEDLSALSEDALAVFRRTKIGIVFQSFHLIPTMSALENVAVPLELAGKTGAREIAKLGRELLGANGICDEYQVMRHLLNIESVYTYEGTHDIHTLALGQHLTGHAAFRG